MMANGKPGRPYKLVADAQTIKVVKGLAKIQATSKEIAAVLEVTEPTWIRFKQENPAVQEAWEQGIGYGQMSIRRHQISLAEKGNATMLIWLGKQYLGQSDRQQLTHSGPNGGPIQHVDLSNVSDDDLQRLEALFGPLAGGAGGDDAGDPGGEGTSGG